MIKGLKKRCLMKNERNWDYAAWRGEGRGQTFAGFQVHEGLVQTG